MIIFMFNTGERKEGGGGWASGGEERGCVVSGGGEELRVGGRSSQHMVSSLWSALPSLELVIRDAACYATNCPPVSWRM